MESLPDHGGFELKQDLRGSFTADLRGLGKVAGLEKKTASQVGAEASAIPA